MIEQNIYSILTGATGVTTYVGSNIFHHHLPDNFDIDGDAIVFIINKEESINSLDEKDCLEQYSLEIIGVSDDTVKIENIINNVESTLQNYSDENIRDCTTIFISPTLDAEKEKYIKKITFNIIYN